jgi:hypothetical protein
MAARKMTKLHQDDVRAKIQSVHLIKVLSDHALGVIEELSPTRIKAIEILLRKSVADLSAVEMTGEGGGPLSVEIVRFGAKSTDA